MQLSLQLQIPQPSDQPQCSVEDSIREVLDCIDSGYDSDVEWIMIRRFYDAICQMRETPRIYNLKQMIEPVLAKYGYFKKV